MQAFQGYIETGRIIPADMPKIQNGLRVIITVSDSTQTTFETEELSYRLYLLADRVIAGTFARGFILFFSAFSIYYLFSSGFGTLGVLCCALSSVAIAIELMLYFYIPHRNFVNSPKLQEGYLLIFSPDEIIFKTQSIDSKLKWDIYSAIWESRDFYFLVQPSKNYTLVPKRVFKNSGEQEIFKSLATGAVKN
ncbi:MAG: YcxB family protein, partial [Synergistaceae bacterium]|nr:YcxB family protein [Synergistaceae bacterium]